MKIDNHGRLIPDETWPTEPREALRFYAEAASWEPHYVPSEEGRSFLLGPPSLVERDQGAIARHALAVDRPPTPLTNCALGTPGCIHRHVTSEEPCSGDARHADRSAEAPLKCTCRGSQYEGDCPRHGDDPPPAALEEMHPEGCRVTHDASWRCSNGTPGCVVSDHIANVKADLRRLLDRRERPTPATCPSCGTTMVRDEDVDAWSDIVEVRAAAHAGAIRGELAALRKVAEAAKALAAKFDMAEARLVGVGDQWHALRDALGDHRRRIAPTEKKG